MAIAKPKKTVKSAGDAALAEWLEKIGEDAMLLTEKPKVVDTISSGNLLVDLVTGINGFPRGRVIEIFGKESSGKSTLAQQIVASLQKSGEKALYVDAEHSFDPTYFRSLGGTKDMVLSQPQSGDRGFAVIRSGLKTRAFGAVVVDSVAALLPKEEFEADDDKEAKGMSLQARMMSEGMRRIIGVIRETNVLAIFINQVREKPGVSFGSPEYTPGGNALKFYATMRVKTQNVGQIKEGDKVVGNTIRIKVLKNKLAPPFRQVEVPLIHGKGFALGEALFDVCMANPALGIVVKTSGKSWTVGGQSVVGKAAAKEAFLENELLQLEAEEAIRTEMAAGNIVLPEKD